ncbi:hypothetical protein JX266_013410 [Neoarthrinium moseri]|uniref:uncharacterized protein n=1 Tax=Neoarthrinium moseri TaxID=1658444 RepID=UPI001FDD72DB|nr:uncharacterized protein JN550_013245 [Neoarthrinium moseri]KAI1840402.1 hypothetical protein JX266_013410 [Neoarthrinium moseri]KAI1857365.1 hypothetical protein JN550_013245 [Neoarthrinium moseri]
MKHRVLLALTALGRFASLGSAEAFSYIEAVVTECDDGDDAYETNAATTAGAIITPPAEHGTCAYTMPPCDCGCPTCTTTSVYTTAYPILCPTGVSDQPYTITETYVGMSTLLPWPTPTSIPYGFTTSEAVCHACGDKPVTTVITCPTGGATYHDSQTVNPHPSPAGPAVSAAVGTEAKSAAYPGGSHAGTVGQSADPVATKPATKSPAQIPANESQNYAESAAPSKQTSVPAADGNNGASQSAKDPAQVSSGSITSRFVAPMLLVVAAVAAQLA